MNSSLTMQKNPPSSPSAMQTKSPTSLYVFLPAVLIALMAIIIEVSLFYAPPNEGQMAVFFPPNTTEVEAITAISRAGGSFIGSSRFSNIVIAYAPDNGFRQRISKHGGWFTLAAEGLCSPSAVESNT